MTQARAFLAITLPPSLLQSVVRLQTRLKNLIPDVRWVRPETLHLTLRFFGDCPQQTLEKIGKAMVSVGIANAPFQVQVSGVDAFPSIRRPRVFWLGLHDDGPLIKLQADLEHALAGEGIPADGRPFSPHLTLGRAKKMMRVDPSLMGKDLNCDLGALPISAITLFASELLPDGARHTPLKITPLGH